MQIYPISCCGGMCSLLNDETFHTTKYILKTYVYFNLPYKSI